MQSRSSETACQPYTTAAAREYTAFGDPCRRKQSTTAETAACAAVNGPIRYACDDTQRDDNEWRVVSRGRSTQNRRTPGQWRNVVNLTTSLPGANTLDMYNVYNVVSWATKRNITHETRRSANTIWPPELLTRIIYVQDIIRTITLCTEVSSGHTLLTLW